MGEGCLVDQLVGQYLAHICGLGYLTDEANVKTTLKSILKYNHREDSNSDFNSMRSYVLGDEKSLVMASWGAVPALSGFQYSAVEQSMTLAASEGSMFWSNGSAWGVCEQTGSMVELTVHHGNIELATFTLGESNPANFENPLNVAAGETAVFEIE